MVSAADETSSATGGASGPALQCLEGAAAPDGLAHDLARVSALPLEALRKFWQVLAPSLAEPIPKETEELLDLFCAAYKIADDELAGALKACRFLVRESARIDLPAQGFAADLERLCPGDAVLRQLLLADYDTAKRALRHDILHAALSDHGNLLVAANWRVDAVVASERGKQLQLPVALLTLHYREGAESRRITLQVLPDMMGRLQAICQEVLK